MSERVPPSATAAGTAPSRARELRLAPRVSRPSVRPSVRLRLWSFSLLASLSGVGPDHASRRTPLDLTFRPSLVRTVQRPSFVCGSCRSQSSPSFLARTWRSRRRGAESQFSAGRLLPRFSAISEEERRRRSLSPPSTVGGERALSFVR